MVNFCSNRRNNGKIKNLVPPGWTRPGSVESQSCTSSRTRLTPGVSKGAGPLHTTVEPDGAHDATRDSAEVTTLRAESMGLRRYRPASQRRVSLRETPGRGRVQNRALYAACSQRRAVIRGSQFRCSSSRHSTWHRLCFAGSGVTRHNTSKWSAPVLFTILTHSTLHLHGKGIPGKRTSRPGTPHRSTKTCLWPWVQTVRSHITFPKATMNLKAAVAQTASAYDKKPDRIFPDSTCACRSSICTTHGVEKVHQGSASKCSPRLSSRTLRDSGLACLQNERA